MDNFVYSAVSNYFSTLEKTGYINGKTTSSLLVLLFYYNLLYNDYRGYISKEDYYSIDRALNCIYGTNCLIPYPDYLKMGKLKLGEITELATRTKNLEEYDKILDKRISDNDVLTADNIHRLDDYGVRLDDHDIHLHQHDEHLAQHDEHLQLHDGQIADHETRVKHLEDTKVIKKMNTIQEIPSIDLSLIDEIDDNNA